MAVNGVSGNNTNVTVVDKDKTGFNGLTADSFMKLLITELQNQDPLEPVGNEQLLNQLSMMRNLQSNIELSDTLKSITSGQQLSQAAALIGKTIQGVNVDEQMIEGTVDRAFIAEGKAYIGVGSTSVALDKLLAVVS